MTISAGLVVEIAFNLIQQLMFIGFLYLFFDKGENKVKNILAFSISVLLLFTMANYFTFNEMTLNHLDSIITIIVMLVYSICFLKGELYLRIIIPIIAFGLNMLIAYLNLFVMSTFGNVPFEEAITFSSSFRYLYVIISDLLYMVVLLILLRIGKRKIQVVSKTEIATFIFIAAALYAGSLSAMLVDKQLFNSEGSTPYIIIILVSLFVSAGVFWFLLLKISKDNQVKTELLLSKQREEMYKLSVLSTNENIEKISQIKHDIKNNTMTISSLIKNGEYDKAQSICDSIAENLSGATPIHTSNPVLNAILNVEIEKADSQSIIFSYEINDTLSFIKDVDIVSIIGNLCDNAIEYLINVPEPSLRKMSLNISAHKNFCYISCKNAIKGSVLSDNPEMVTSKEDSILHGKGLSILKRIAKSYYGEVRIKEENQELIVSIIIRKQN